MERTSSPGYTAMGKKTQYTQKNIPFHIPFIENTNVPFVLAWGKGKWTECPGALTHNMHITINTHAIQPIRTS